MVRKQTMVITAKNDKIAVAIKRTIISRKWYRNCIDIIDLSWHQCSKQNGVNVQSACHDVIMIFMPKVYFYDLKSAWIRIVSYCGCIFFISLGILTLKWIIHLQRHVALNCWFIICENRILTIWSMWRRSHIETNSQINCSYLRNMSITPSTRGFRWIKYWLNLKTGYLISPHPNMCNNCTD